MTQCAILNQILPQVSAALQECRVKESRSEEQPEEEKEEEAVSRDAQPSPPSDAVVSGHVTPPLSGSAQGRPQSKLSSIVEAEEQEQKD